MAVPNPRRHAPQLSAALAPLLIALTPLTAAAAQPPAADAASSTSFAAAFFISRGSVFGTALIWLLLLLSVVSLSLIVFMWWNNRRINILPPRTIEEVHRLIEMKQYRELIAFAEREGSFFGRILAAGLSEASHGFPAILRAIDQAAEELISRRLRRIEFLNVLGIVSPMIGLFGTVYGMILAFQAIVDAGGRPDPVDLAAGIGTALITTFWGLIVAIPSLAAYALIRNSIDALTLEAVIKAEEVANRFRPQPGAAAPMPPPPARPASPPPPPTRKA